MFISKQCFISFQVERKKRKAPTERLPYKSPKQQRLDMQEAADGILQLQKPLILAPTETVEDVCLPSTSTNLPSPCETEPSSKSVGIHCAPDTDSKSCQTEKKATSDVVQLSLKKTKF